MTRECIPLGSALPRAWILSVTTPMVLLVGLLRLADTLLPRTGPEDGDMAQTNQPMPW